MNKIVYVLPFILAGCAKDLPPQVLVRNQGVVVMPDIKLFHCPNVREFPNPDTLTDVEVSKLLVRMHTNNTVCQKNINSIYKVLDDAKKTTKKK
jgi:hypothetical protein